MSHRYSYTHGVRLADELDAIVMGAYVFIPGTGEYGFVVEREEGERVLGYFVQVDGQPGKVVRLKPDELEPVRAKGRLVSNPPLPKRP